MTGLFDRLIERMAATETAVQPNLPERFSAALPWSGEVAEEPPLTEPVATRPRPSVASQQSDSDTSTDTQTDQSQKPVPATGGIDKPVTTEPDTTANARNSQSPATNLSDVAARGVRIDERPVMALNEPERVVIDPALSPNVPAEVSATNAHSATDTTIEYHTHVTQQSIDNRTLVQPGPTTPQPKSATERLPTAKPEQPTREQQQSKLAPPVVPAPQVKLPYAPVTSPVQAAGRTELPVKHVESRQTPQQISVTIDTVEINATAPVTHTSRKSAVRTRQPAMTLEHYLSGRERSR